MYKDKRKKTSSQVICQLFNLPLSETIYQDYSCSYIGAITFFGRIFIGEDHFCFNSNMFGITKQFAIKIDDIVKIDLEKNKIAGAYKDGVGSENNFVFGNFANAASTFKLMHGLWKGEIIEAKILGSNEQQKFSEQEGMLQEGSTVQVDFFNREVTSSGDKQTLTKITFPCSLQQYYDFFLSDKASLLSSKQYFELKGSENVKVTEWAKNQELGREVRQITAVIRVTGVPMLSQARFQQIQTMTRTQKEINISSVAQMSDVPYAAYFTLQQQLKIMCVDDKKCSLEVVSWLTFNKSTMMRRTITQKTNKDLKEDYQVWIKTVQQRLNRRVRRSSSFSSTQNSLQYEKADSLVLGFTKIMDQSFETQPVNKEGDQSRLRKIQIKLDILISLVVLLLAITVYSLTQ